MNTVMQHNKMRCDTCFDAYLDTQDVRTRDALWSEIRRSRFNPDWKINDWIDQHILTCDDGMAWEWSTVFMHAMENLPDDCYFHLDNESFLWRAFQGGSSLKAFLRKRFEWEKYIQRLPVQLHVPGSLRYWLWFGSQCDRLPTKLDDRFLALVQLRHPFFNYPVSIFEGCSWKAALESVERMCNSGEGFSYADTSWMDN